MRVLIVGCGYIGLPLGAELVKEGHEVFGLRRSAGAAAALETAGVKPLVADITRPETLRDIPARYDWVINCVSASGGGAAEYRAVYLQGTRNLIEWLSPQPPQKFVYTSSTSVYGQTDGSVVTETSPTEPASEAANILVATEKVLLDAVKRGFPAVILRLAGIYGPGRGYWFKQFMNGEARIDGDGSRILNMVHRDDVVGAICAALKDGQAGEIYNVVDDEPVTQLVFFQSVSTTLGRALPPLTGEVRQRLSNRPVTNKRVSNLQLKSKLGFRFKYRTFRDGLASGESA
jgi:nucleoside-diphosphate-sugar epimerase